LIQLFRGVVAAARLRRARKPDAEKGGCGTGFVAALPEGDAETLVDDSDDARIIGRVEEGEESVAIRGLELSE
jgi:hypothetical protein